MEKEIYFQKPLGEKTLFIEKSQKKIVPEKEFNSVYRKLLHFFSLFQRRLVATDRNATDIID